MKRILIVMLLTIPAASFLHAQSIIKWDAFGTIFYASEGNFNLTFSLEKPLGDHSSFQLGLTAGNFINERTYRDSTDLFGPPLDYERSLWAVGLVPEYRYYFRGRQDGRSGGLFVSPFGKALFSWVHTDDYLNETEDTELGYVLGIGLGLGYQFRLNNWSIEPFIGLGKGASSHQEIFEPGGFLLDFVNPDLMIHRFELQVGYQFGR